MSQRHALRSIVRVAALALASIVASPAAAASGGLPSGAVVAFTPQTVCESLPGGWQEFAPAAGRVVVGATPGLASAIPPPLAQGGADYWTKGVTLKPENLPRAVVAGAGQIIVTTPEVPARTASAGAKAIFSGETPDTWLFGYRPGAANAPPSQSLPVGYGAAGAVGRDHPDAVPVAPPYVALRYCVKN